jgi:hypothetical protein
MTLSSVNSGSASISSTPSSETPQTSRRSSKQSNQGSETSQSRSASVVEAKPTHTGLPSVPDDAILLDFNPCDARVDILLYCTSPIIHLYSPMSTLTKSSFNHTMPAQSMSRRL